MSKKVRLAKFLHATHLLAHLASRTEGNLLVFNYHRIRPDEPDFVTPFDEGVYGPTAAQFYAQMQWLKRHRTVLTEDELIEGVKHGHHLRGCVVITFDDGYCDNYTLAYPILKALELPAIFFIPTALIQTRRLGWWDLIAYLVKQCRRPTIHFAGQVLPCREQPAAVIEFFTQKMKLEKAETTADLVETLAAACGVPLPAPTLQASQLMSWAQIRQVATTTITIGSHTHTHRVLATLDACAQREELGSSKALLERMLDRPIRSLAYPVGGTRHFSAETQSIAQASGYELGFSFRTGRNPAHGLMPLAIKRVAGPTQLSMVAATAVLPTVFIGGEDATRYRTASFA